MKTYSLGSAPTCAGIYYLTNKQSGHIYVGKTTSLRRRLAEWRNAVMSGFGHTNSEMFNAMQQNPDPDEWVFVVSKEMPRATKQELLAAENKEIGRLRSLVPHLVLNIPTPEKMVEASTNAYPGSVVLVTDEGQIVGQLMASKILGRNPDTIKAKVRWLKEHGVTSVNVSDLTMDRRKLLEKIRGE